MSRKRKACGTVEFMYSDHPIDWSFFNCFRPKSITLSDGRKACYFGKTKSNMALPGIELYMRYYLNDPCKSKVDDEQGKVLIMMAIAGLSDTRPHPKGPNQAWHEVVDHHIPDTFLPPQSGRRTQAMSEPYLALVRHEQNPTKHPVVDAERAKSILEPRLFEAANMKRMQEEQEKKIEGILAVYKEIATGESAKRYHRDLEDFDKSLTNTPRAEIAQFLENQITSLISGFGTWADLEDQARTFVRNGIVGEQSETPDIRILGQASRSIKPR